VVTSAPTIGVVALQGDVREHLETLTRLGVNAIKVRRSEDLSRCHGLVLPGGESTTMVKLAASFELLEPLREWTAAGRPAFGTCAGMIMLADRVEDGIEGQETVGGLDITVRRNAFGRQIDSFEAELSMVGLDAAVHAVFIRAPWVERVADQVEVLARAPEIAPGDETASRIVAVRQGALMATSFHPEVGGDDRVHGLFVDLVTQS